eukprot:TRINITY_DN393_c0_g2_i2.p1 TRINITY_DN393_c0_g2~~TRINITY_DN393_c0_g2_i2.p1  ORF type:complete len:122 (+),score=29.79 TRINITY_DN393_c0_g2_i2:220-585(+)
MKVQLLALVMLLSIPAIIALTCDIRGCHYTDAGCKGNEDCQSSELDETKCYILPFGYTTTTYSVNCTSKTVDIFTTTGCNGTGSKFVDGSCALGMVEFTFVTSSSSVSSSSALTSWMKWIV